METEKLKPDSLKPMLSPLSRVTYWFDEPTLKKVTQIKPYAKEYILLQLKELIMLTK